MSRHVYIVDNKVVDSQEFYNTLTVYEHGPNFNFEHKEQIKDDNMIYHTLTSSS